MNHTVKSLLFVVEHSVQAVEDFTAQLSRLQPGDKRIPPLLKSLSTEADVLSSALVAASKHVEALPEHDKMCSHGSDKGRKSLRVSQRFFAAIERGICVQCGGVNRREIS